MGEGAGPTHAATALQSLAQSRNLHLAAAEVDESERATSEMMQALRAVWMPALFALLTERSQERFSNRKLNLALEKGDEEHAWDEARHGGLKALSELLRRNQGPYVMGQEGKRHGGINFAVHPESLVVITFMPAHHRSTSSCIATDPSASLLCRLCHRRKSAVLASRQCQHLSTGGG